MPAPGAPPWVGECDGSEHGARRRWEPWGLGAEHRPLTCTWLHSFLGTTVRPLPGTRPIGSHQDRDADPDPPGEATRPTNGEIHASAIRLQELPAQGGRPVISPDDRWVSSGTAPRPPPPTCARGAGAFTCPPCSRWDRRVHTSRALGQERGGRAGAAGTRGQQGAAVGGGAPGHPGGITPEAQRRFPPDESTSASVAGKKNVFIKTSQDCFRSPRN